MGQSNMTAICLGSDIVVIDTFISPKTARKAKEMIMTHFPDAEISTVISTHGHHDHTYGNQVFRDAQILAHENAEYWMHLGLKLPGIREKLENDVEKFTLTKAHVTISNQTTINIGNVDIHLIPFGAGHSNSDILIAIPLLETLIIGDIIFARGFPNFKHYRGNQWFPGDWDVPQWINGLKTTLELGDYKYVIPGHGSLIHPERIRLWLEYFESLWHDVTKLSSDTASIEMIVPPLLTKSYYKNLFKRMGFSQFPGGHHETFIRQFYQTYKNKQK
jgi:glyoxylase-like metal-dependent hydrolase (beta-lactamase superfamily II)